MMTTSTYAMIPARKGSQRLEHKNMALIDGEPMIAHVIEAASESGVFDEIIVNSDAEVFGDIARERGAQFYHRLPELGSSETKSDEVVYDFIQSNPCDQLAWVNPISPLQPAAEIRDVIEYFGDEGLDSLFTVKQEQVHAIHKDEPVNFSWDGLFAKTQELLPVFPFVYSVMMWDTETFVTQYESEGHGLFCGETGFYPVCDESSIIIKHPEDLQLADAIMRGRREQSDEVEYHDLVDELR